MKFYQVVQAYTDRKAVVASNPTYGPFQDLTQLRAHAAEQYFDKTRKLLIFDAEFADVPPNPQEKPESEKREPGDEKNWTKIGDERWVCKTCGATIMSARVAHPIHIRGTGGGFGECRYEEIGYCPNCEKKPNFHGSIVYES